MTPLLWIICGRCGHEWRDDQLGDCEVCGGTAALAATSRRVAKRISAHRLADGRVLVTFAADNTAWHALVPADQWAALVASVAP